MPMYIYNVYISLYKNCRQITCNLSSQYQMALRSISIRIRYFGGKTFRCQSVSHNAIAGQRRACFLPFIHWFVGLKWILQSSETFLELELYIRMVPFILTLFVASIFFILIVASCVYNLYVFIRRVLFY